jgi:hypothetical protein
MENSPNINHWRGGGVDLRAGLDALSCERTRLPHIPDNRLTDGGGRCGAEENVLPRPTHATTSAAHTIVIEFSISYAAV